MRCSCELRQPIWLLLQLTLYSDLVVPSSNPARLAPWRPEWLDEDERAAWLRLVAVVELLPGVLDAQLRRRRRADPLRVLRAGDAVGGARAHAADDRRWPSAPTPRCRGSPTSYAGWRTAGWSSGSRAPRTAAPPTPGSPTPAGTPWSPPRPGHVDTVRRHVLDPLTPEQLEQLRGIGDALLTRLDPEGRMTALYDPDQAAGDIA